MNVNWMLFRMHYLRVLAPLAGVTFGTYLITLLAAQITRSFGSADAEQMRTGFNIVCAVLVAFTALPVGAAVFSRAFKEQHVLFFHALPVPRLRQWMLLALASASALLTVAAGFAIVHPSWVAEIWRGDLGYVYPAGVLVSFTAGLCFSLLFRRTVAVYFAAYATTVLLALIIGTMFVAPIMLHGGSGVSRMDLANAFLDAATILSATAVWSIALPLALLFTVSSALFYRRGEVTLPRLQLAHAAIVLVASVVLGCGLALLVTSLARGDEEVYQRARWRDGKAIAIVHRGAVQWRPRVELHANGARVERRIDGLKHLWFASDGRLYAIVRDLSLARRMLFLLDADSRVVELGPDLRVRAASALGGEDLLILPARDRALAVVVRDRELARIVSVRGTHVRTLATVPAAGFVDGYRSLVFFLDSNEPPRIFRLEGNTARELRRVAGAANNYAEPCLFGDVFYPTCNALEAALEREWPLPRAAGETVTYAPKPRIEQRWIYGLSGSMLSVFDTAAKRWTLAARDVTPVRNARGRIDFAPSAGDTRFAVYTRPGARGRVWLVYDAATAKERRVYEEDASGSVNVQVMHGQIIVSRGTEQVAAYDIAP